MSLSTGPGNALVKKIANSAYPGSIEFDAFHIGWLSGIHLKNLQITDEKTRPVLSVKTFDLDRSFLSFLFSPTRLGNITCVSPQAHLYEETKKEKSSSPKQELSSSQKTKGISYFPLNAQVNIHDGSLEIHGEKTAPAGIENVECSLVADLPSTLNAKMQAILKNGKTKAPISAQAQLSGDCLENATGTAQIECAQIPTEVMQSFAEQIDPQLPKIFQEIFGSAFTFQCNGSLDKGLLSCKTNLSGTNLSSKISFSLKDFLFTLDEGELLSATCTPQLFSNLSSYLAQKTPFSLREKTTFVIRNTKACTFDLSTFAAQNPAKITFATQNPIILQSEKEKDPLSISIDGNISNDTKITTLQTSIFSSLGTASLVNISEEIQAKIEKDLFVIPSGNITIDMFQPFFQKLSLPIALQPVSKISNTVHIDTLSFPISSRSQSPFFSAFSLSILTKLPQLSVNDSLVLAKPTEIQTNVIKYTKENECTFTSKAFFPLQIKGKEQNIAYDIAGKYDLAKSSLSCDKVALTTPSAQSFSSGSFDLSSMQGNFSTSLSQGDKTILKASSSFDIKDSPKASAKASLQNFPLSLIQSFIDKDLSALVGPTINSQIDMQFAGLDKSGNSIDIESEGSFWKNGVHLTLSNGKLSVPSNKPCSLSGTVTQEQLQAFQKLFSSPSSIKIPSNVSFTAKIPTFSVDISPLLEKRFEKNVFFRVLDTMRLDADGKITPLQLASNGKTFLNLDALTFVSHLSGETRSGNFSLNTPQGSATEISLTGKIDNAWKEDGFNSSSLSSSSQILIKNFPTQTFSLFLPEKGDLLAQTLGPNLTISGQIQIEKMKTGQAILNCSSKNSSLHFDGYVENSILHLKNAAKATLKITPQAAELFLKSVAPMLATASQSDQAIEVTIAPENVSIPLKPFSLQTMTIPSITVNMGKLSVKNEGTLKVILGVLGQTKAAGEQTVSVWPTPIYASVRSGIVDCKRTDILVADSIHMIYWGIADLRNSSLNMMVAIPSKTLQELRLVPREFRPSSLQIPITGPMDNPNIDTKRALAKLTGANVAGYAKDPQLKLFGALVEAASSIGEEDEKIPPPTTSPFPWEKNRPSRYNG